MYVTLPLNMGNGVLVTGGAKRIGREICLKLARSGKPIAVQYNNSRLEAQTLVEEIESLGVAAASLQCDLSNFESTAALFSDASEKIGTITGLVNNASHFVHDEITNFDAISWKSHMDVNALAPLVLIRSLYESIQDGVTGSVVNILDQKLASPNPDHISYTASKFALAGITEALSRGLAPSVRVNAVSPGHTLPSNDQSKIGFERAQSQTPLGHGPSPEQVADSVSFLMGAHSITGQVIYVDSGERFLNRSRDVLFETEE